MDIDTRSRISIEGKLSKDLFVHYDIEQEPEMPGKYDVEIDYKDHHLQFFHLNAAYKQGEYINVNKALRGAQYKYDGEYQFFQTSMGKERSESHKLENFGSGARLIKLSHKYIFPGSVRVYINNRKKNENVDYTVDYYKGTVLFEFPIDQTDYYKIIYEVSNPIADYLPVLARKNFQAIQYASTPRQIAKFELESSSKTETFIYKQTRAEPEYPTFNIDALSYPSLNDYEKEHIVAYLIQEDFLKADLTVGQHIATTAIMEVEGSVIPTAALVPLQATLKELGTDTMLVKQATEPRYSKTQIFPDTFTNLEGFFLKDSVNIFLYLQEKNIINSQGFITLDLVSYASIFDVSSAYYYYDQVILEWLKIFFLEKNLQERPRFILEKQPLVLGSVSVLLNDIELMMNHDYTLDYTLGVLAVSVPLVADDTLRVHYDYYSKKEMMEEFIGKNSTGPYSLSFSPVVDGSVKIALNDQTLAELDDYVIDYDSGDIFFSTDIAYPAIFSAITNSASTDILSFKDPLIVEPNI